MSAARRAGRTALLALSATAIAAIAGCDLNENADLERGRQLFVANCGRCHQLAQAGTPGTIGPDLDAAFVEPRANGMDNDTIEGVVQAQIANPREIDEGSPNFDRVFMPADLVTGQDAEDVAAYVGSVAGVPGAEPPDLTPDQLFVEQCGSCHTLEAAQTTGTIGPNLDEVLPGQGASQIETSIVDPAQKITPGFPNAMPAIFGDSLTPEQLKGLVDFLRENAGKGGQ